MKINLKNHFAKHYQQEIVEPELIEPTLESVYDPKHEAKKSISQIELDMLSDHEDEKVRYAVAKNFYTSQRTLLHLIQKSTPNILQAIAEREDLSNDVIENIILNATTDYIYKLLLYNNKDIPTEFILLIYMKIENTRYFTFSTNMIIMHKNTPIEILLDYKKDPYLKKQIINNSPLLEKSKYAIYFLDDTNE